MRTVEAVYSGVMLVALVGCVHSSSLYKKDTPASHWARAATMDERVAGSDSARLQGTGFFQRQASVLDAYFVGPDEIAKIAPKTIADIFRHVPVLVESPIPIEGRSVGSQPCFLTYVNGLMRSSTLLSDFDTFIRARDVVAAEVYPPGQLPPPPFARSGAQENCTTVALWTRSSPPTKGSTLVIWK